MACLNYSRGAVYLSKNRNILLDLNVKDLGFWIHNVITLVCEGTNHRVHWSKLQSPCQRTEQQGAVETFLVSEASQCPCFIGTGFSVCAWSL
jgi:hypothetical protein